MTTICFPAQFVKRSLIDALTLELPTLLGSWTKAEFEKNYQKGSKELGNSSYAKNNAIQRMNYIDVFEEQIAFNSALLLTTVAYLFITKDVTPDTSVITMLDIITYGSLVLSWALIMIQAVATSDDTTRITQVLCAFVTGVQLILYISLYLRYKYFSWTSEQLGDYK